MLAELATSVAMATHMAVYAPPKAQERLGTLDIPAIHLSIPVRQGVSHRVLEDAVGHYPGTYLPGMGGRIVLPAHDVTPVRGMWHGPFYYINRLRKGDRATFHMPYGTYRYEVVRKKVLYYTMTGYLVPHLGHEQLVLATCWPRHSRSHRYLVFLRRDS